MTASIPKFSIPIQFVDHMFLNAHTQVPVFTATISGEGIKTVTVRKGDVSKFVSILRGSLFQIVSHKVKETSLKILVTFKTYDQFDSAFEAFWEEKTNKLYIVGTDESTTPQPTITPHAAIFKCATTKKAWLKIDLSTLKTKDNISVCTTDVDRIEKIEYICIDKKEKFYVYRQRESLYTTVNLKQLQT